MSGQNGAAAVAQSPTIYPSAQPAGDGPVLSLRGVTKSYEPGRPPAVDALDLAIEPGEFFSLLGPSGSGKTTTLRLIAGFEAPDAGALLLDGADVARVPPFKRDVSTVFQSYALFPHMTVARNVMYPLRMRRVEKREQKRRVAEALELVSMAAYAQRMPHQLSGGQRQRIALARALVSRPRVVLLDEPLGALDLQLRQQMQLMLKQLQREVGATFVYVTHDQGEALAMSDRLAVMNDGRLEQLGTPVDVYYRPASRFVASFIGKSNLVPCTIAGGDATATAGDLRIRLGDGHPDGAATLAIRYEALVVHTPGAGEPPANAREATVREAIFLGDGVELVLDAGGQQLVAKCPSNRVSSHVLGERLLVGVESADVVVLHD